MNEKSESLKYGISASTVGGSESASPLHNPDCLLDADKIDLVLGRLKGKHLEQVKKHSEECDTCKQAVAAYMKIAHVEVPADTSSAEVKSPKKTKKAVSVKLVIATVVPAFLIVGLAVASLQAHNGDLERKLQKSTRDLFATAAARDAALRQVEELLVSKKLGKPFQPPTPSSRYWDFERARKVDLVFGYQGDPKRLGIKLNSFLAYPNYNCLEIVWGEDNRPPLEPEVVYQAPDKPFAPIIAHEYKLPEPGNTRRATLKLIFYPSGMAMQEFGAKPIITETISILLSAQGIRMAFAGLDSTVHLEFLEPKRGETVKQTDFPLTFNVQITDAAVKKASLDPAALGIAYVLVRPKDGPKKLQERYWIQQFRLDLADLTQTGKSGIYRQETWVTLRGVLNEVPKGRSAPTQFEVTIVILRVRLDVGEIPVQVLDFQSKELHGLVRVTRDIVLQPPPKLK